MKVATSDQMREIDRVTIEEYGIPGLVLMERAGLAVARRITELRQGGKVLVLCGGGNNGGDGIVVARILHNGGYHVKVLLFAAEEVLSADCRHQYDIARRMDIPVEFRASLHSSDVHGALVVDALFGTGLSRPVTGQLAGVLSFLNDHDATVVAVDMPSGISSDTGEVLGEAVMADVTVTFGLPKRGHLLYPGAEYTGKLFVEDIGFPRELLESDSLGVETFTPASFGVIPVRRKNAYKGDYGHVFVIAGSRGKTGAAVMTAKSCLRSGAGLVTVGVPSSLIDAFQARVTEEMTLPLPDDGTGMLSPEALDVILDFITRKIDVIAIGPGIGVSEATREIITGLVLRSPVPLVIDADGLNSLQGRVQDLADAKSPLVLTPHPGEMRRLLGQEDLKVTDIERDRIGISLQFAAETGTHLVLKGVPTVTATPEGRAFLNTSGNPGMASAGSGDVLTGVIASLLGQGFSPEQSAILGVYLHGLAGDFAAADKGEASLIASDIIDHLPPAIRSVVDGTAGMPWKTN